MAKSKTSGAITKLLWALHKTEIAWSWLLRGEEMELVRLEVGRTVAERPLWEEAFLAAGSAGPKERLEKDEAEIRRLNEKVGEQTI